MDIYKIATKEGYRFRTRVGMLILEQLWSLNLDQLNELAISLDTQQAQSTKTFLKRVSSEDKETKIKLDIVVDIINTKQDEIENAQKESERRENNKKLMNLIAQKQDQELMGKSVEELEALLQ